MFLSAKGIPFTEVNIEEDPEAVEFVMRVNAGKRSVPTVVAGGVAASLSGFSPIKAHEFLACAGLATL
ncbi:MAG: glutaredoxin family protein [Trueperaceae bacterium]|nr:glutaredoxin family protein [Trueperaceae bacterium]